jgi:hypothetical protein
MTLRRLRIQESDSDSDLIIPVKKKAKDQVKDLKKIIQLNSNARKKRENYDNLSLKIHNSVKAEEKIQEKVLTIPDFIKEDPSKYFKTNTVLAMLKTGKFTRNLDNFKWLMHVLKQDNDWKFKVIQVLVEFLSEYSKQERWEMILEYVNDGKVVLELVKEVEKKGDFEIFQKFVQLSRDNGLFSKCFVEFLYIFEELLQGLDDVILFSKTRK